MYSLLAQTEGLAAPLQAVSEQGAMVVVIIAGIAILGWWVKYVSAPKAKIEMENSIKVADRQVKFIDNVERILSSQADMINMVLDNDKEQVAVLESTQQKVEKTKTKVESIVNSLFVVSDLLATGSINDRDLSIYADKIRQELKS
jgi:uncharacterized membrane protein YhiD involved in acid resistance